MIEKSNHPIRCPKCETWATFLRDESRVHYCFNCGERFSGLDVLAMVVIQ